MDKNYILIIGWVAVMAMLSVLTSVKRVETVCGKKEYRWRPVWAVVTFLPLIIWCGYRENIGDTWAYKKKLFRNAGKFRWYGVLYGNSKEG